MVFFAVSKNSVYLVSDKTDEKGVPIVEKIANKGGMSIKIGERLKGGRLVGVTRKGIMLYSEDHSKPGAIQPPEMVNTRFHGGHTSSVVGLFFDQEHAMACFNSSDLKECDPRWKDQTECVLRAIGDTHDTFVITKWKPWAFTY